MEMGGNAWPQIYLLRPLVLASAAADCFNGKTHALGGITTRERRFTPMHKLTRHDAITIDCNVGGWIVEDVDSLAPAFY